MLGRHTCRSVVRAVPLRLDLVVRIENQPTERIGDALRRADQATAFDAERRRTELHSDRTVGVVVVMDEDAGRSALVHAGVFGDSAAHENALPVVAPTLTDSVAEVRQRSIAARAQEQLRRVHRSGGEEQAMRVEVNGVEHHPVLVDLIGRHAISARRIFADRRDEMLRAHIDESGRLGHREVAAIDRMLGTAVEAVDVVAVDRLRGDLPIELGAQEIPIECHRVLLHHQPGGRCIAEEDPARRVGRGIEHVVRHRRRIHDRAHARVVHGVHLGVVDVGGKHPREELARRLQHQARVHERSAADAGRAHHVDVRAQELLQHTDVGRVF
jgi:hypothetical protein